jgi:hypothetical protein
LRKEGRQRPSKWKCPLSWWSWPCMNQLSTLKKFKWGEMNSSSHCFKGGNRSNVVSCIGKNKNNDSPFITTSVSRPLDTVLSSFHLRCALHKQLKTEMCFQRFHSDY